MYDIGKCRKRSSRPSRSRHSPASHPACRPAPPRNCTLRSLRDREASGRCQCWDSGTDAEYRGKRAAVHRAYSPRRMLIKWSCRKLIGAFDLVAGPWRDTWGAPSLEPSIRKKPLPCRTAGVLLREINCEISASRSCCLSPEINSPFDVFRLSGRWSCGAG
jgi:hypothetical protein